MKRFLLLCSLFFSAALFAQTAKTTTYTGKVGLSTIEFNHVPFPLGSTAKISTSRSTDTYTNCSEDENPKVQKLCFFDSKKGFDYKKHLKLNLPASAKKLPDTITGTYTINGLPVKFSLKKI
jgi:hypothetical protein